MNKIILLIIGLVFIGTIVLYILKRDEMAMHEKIIRHNNISLYTENFGNIDNPAVILISGAGASARFWTNDLIKPIVDADYFVIRFDHRDSGLSSAVNFETDPYTVYDLAKDIIAILDAYKIKKAHKVGHSMGGIIAQLLAINYPERVLSMTSMSVGTVGEVAAPSQEVMNVLLENKPTQNFEQSLSGYMKSWKILNGTYNLDETKAQAYTQDLYKRSHHLAGVAWNHIKAQEGLDDLTEKLKTISVPAFFIHGEADVLIPVQAGIATARTVPHSKIEIILGMGHMIFNKKIEQLLARILIRNFKLIHLNNE